ncbi:DUF6879 family protein [Streptomyces sp. NPDC048606]|uniref:DUF6879 family protein n=1 Tax=Streptomyces sp. NPDC048606 TaxID=3154726 RepID=UPI0034361D28
MASSSGLAELFERFRHEAFRLETLDDYSGSGNIDAYRAFRAGLGRPAGYNTEWLEELRRLTQQGKRVYRVHVLRRPLTEYLRFELGWGYRTNTTAGEEFFILDVTGASNPLEAAPDFWLFDSEDTAVMRYDDAGAFLGAEVLPRDEAADYVAYRRTALAHAEPFADWWAKYGE